MQEEVAMTAPLHVPVHLEARESLPVTNGRGLEIHCLGGNLWITQSGDHRDIVLYAGEKFTLDRRGLSLITALLQPADLVVEPAAEERPESREDEFVPNLPIAA
jgi:Protein of unknown function (DUF2917)